MGNVLMSVFKDFLPDIVQRSRGLVLVVLAFAIVFGAVQINPPESGPTMVVYCAIGFAVLLAVAGIAFVFLELRLASSPTNGDVAVADVDDLQHVVKQLGRNYDVLRRQATQGFIFAGTFMALGLCVILAGAVGNLFGFTTQGINLTTVAGVVVEMVSALGLYLFNQTFRQLNATSDKLHESWRILAAFNQAEKLPDDKRVQVIEKLITTLIEKKAI